MNVKRWQHRILAAALLASFAGAASAQATIAYTYDALGRVTGVTAPNGTTTLYTYDNADNRAHKVTANAGYPAAFNVSANVPYNTPTAMTLNVVGSYSSVAVPNAPSHGSTSISGTSITYTPTTGYSGADSFTYTATNSAGTSAPATVTLTVGSGTMTATIQLTGSGPVDLRQWANGYGYTGTQNANITFEVGNGVAIMGTPGGGRGIDTGLWPTSGPTTTLTLIVKSGGAVYGGGGNGGTGGAAGADYGLTSGGAGGDAVYAQAPIVITVQSGGAIKGGGIGGSGGSGGDSFDPNTNVDYCWGGGGGGGGFPNGAGGPGGDTTQSPYYSGCYVGNSGSDGTTSGGGAGGARLWDSPNYMGDGSTGGAAGSGYAVRKNGHTVTVSGAGTVTGTVN